MKELLSIFGFECGKHSVKTEFLAGLTTFLTMSYILAVNPAIFAPLAAQGMDTAAVFSATALAAAVGSLLMAYVGKLPFGLAPGMGLNAFFVYTVCLTMGYSWQFALTAVLIEGIVFVLLTITKLRALIVDTIPANLKRAIGVGIGLFIAFIGLKNAGIIIADDSTFVKLGTITQGAPLLAWVGLFFTTALVVWNVRGALLLGMIATTIIGIPMGITQWQGLLSAPASVAPLLCQFQWNQIFSTDMLIVVLTLLFLDMFDTIGTLVGVCIQSKMVNSDGSIPRLNHAFMSDALATIFGACVGTNTTTTFVESTTGVSQGGRTGLTAFTVGILFLASLFFAPLFLSIPSAATAPVMIIVGIMMMKPLAEIDMNDFSEFVPAFVTIVMMPFSGSISDGIMLGVISYTVVNVCSGKPKKVGVALWLLTLCFVLKYIFL